jgi:hypothetical protein
MTSGSRAVPPPATRLSADVDLNQRLLDGDIRGIVADDKLARARVAGREQRISR